MGTLNVDKLAKTSTGAAEFTLPATDGTSGQVMQTDGSGQLSIGAYTIPADAVGASQIATDAVGSSEIAANAVTSSEIADDAVTIAKLAATGTASATTFLRGDNSWATAGGDNTPAFEYQLASAQTTADATWATIQFASKIYDTDGSGGTVYDTSTYTFTVPSGQAGKYFIYCGVVLIATAGGNQANQTSILFKDKDDNNAGTAEANTSGHGYMHTLNMASVFDMAVGDSLKLRGYMDTTGGGTVTFGHDAYPRSYFGGFKMIGV